MGVHLHHSIHGVGAQKLPHAATFPQAISSDKEWRYGTDPVQFLGGRGVRLFGSQITACPQWSANWSIA